MIPQLGPSQPFMLSSTLPFLLYQHLPHLQERIQHPLPCSHARELIPSPNLSLPGHPKHPTRSA